MRRRRSTLVNGEGEVDEKRGMPRRAITPSALYATDLLTISAMSGHPPLATYMTHGDQMHTKAANDTEHSMSIDPFFGLLPDFD